VVGLVRRLRRVRHLAALEHRQLAQGFHLRLVGRPEVVIQELDGLGSVRFGELEQCLVLGGQDLALRDRVVQQRLALGGIDVLVELLVVVRIGLAPGQDALANILHFGFGGGQQHAAHLDRVVERDLDDVVDQLDLRVAVFRDLAGLLVHRGHALQALDGLDDQQDQHDAEAEC